MRNEEWGIVPVSSNDQYLHFFHLQMNFEIRDASTSTTKWCARHSSPHSVGQPIAIVLTKLLASIEPQVEDSGKTYAGNRIIEPEGTEGFLIVH